MPNKTKKSTKLPPIRNGDIAEIYPWVGFWKDHVDCFLYPFKQIIRLFRFKQGNDLLTLRNFFRSENIFLLDSGRSALILGLRSLRLSPRAEVLISAFNCTAVYEAIVAAGATPRFIDIDKDGRIDKSSLQERMSADSEALIVTHPFGIVDDLKHLSKFCQKNNIALINDLAQTLEDSDKKQRLNEYGKLSIYSFGPEKHLYALGGGALLTHDKILARTIKNNLPQKRVSYSFLVREILQRWKYYFTFFSHKYLHVIVPLLERLKVIASISTNKQISIDKSTTCIQRIHPVQQHILARKLRNYSHGLTNSYSNFLYLGQNIHHRLLTGNCIYPLYATVDIYPHNRYEFTTFLSRRGVHTVWNYYPLYKAEGVPGCANKLPTTEKLWQNVVSIPFRHPLTKKRAKQICQIVNEYSQQHQKDKYR